MTAATSERGGSLIEVMTAMVILAFSILGVAAMFQWADGGVRVGDRGAKALALAQARLEAKRAAPWSSLLIDDVDVDGTPDVIMRDDGSQGDAQASDGVYTGRFEQNRVVLEWTVASVGGGPLQTAPAVVIQSRARYDVASDSRTIVLATLRANPSYVGNH